MFNFRNPIVNKDLRDYIKKSNDSYFNKLQKINYTNKEHISDYEFDFCDISENCECNECNIIKKNKKYEKNNKHEKLDNNKIIEYQDKKYNSFIWMILAGSSVFSISVLFYKFYINR